MPETIDQRANLIRRRPIGLLAGLALLACTSAPVVHAEEPVELIRKSLAVHRLADETEERTMRIVGASGEAKERRITLWSMTTDKGLARTLARFTTPRDVEGTAILTWEGEAGSGGDQWMFLPALRKAKRIASGGKKTRFMGTDFAYEDLAPEDPSSWTYSAAGEGDFEGAPCWILEAVPASPSVDTGYSKRRLHLRKDNLYIVQRELFDASGTLAKVQSDRKVVNVSGSAWRADEVTMQDKVAGTSTTLTIRKREHDKGLKEDFFTVARLEAGDEF